MSALACPPAWQEAPAGAHAEVFRPDGARWQITPPEPWRLAPAETLDLVNAQARARGLTSPYVAMFVTDLSGGPYALVQVGEALKPGFDAPTLARAIGAGIQKGMESVGEAPRAEGPVAPSGVFDAAKVEHRTTGSIAQEDGSTIAMTSIGHFGLDATVFLHLYTPGAPTEDSRRTLESLNDGFAFDAGRVYQLAPAPRPAGPAAGGRVAGVVAGSIAGVLVLAVVWWVRRARA